MDCVNCEVEWGYDEHGDLNYPRIQGDQRPAHVLVENDALVGQHFGRAEDFHRHYVQMADNDLWVPAREAFLAYGGDLIYDVIMVVGFDGVHSPLLEVRYLVRPDIQKPISTTLTRSIRLDPLLRRAISECRSAYRLVEDNHVTWVSPQERQAVYLPAIKRGRGESRRYVKDRELERVAEIYRRAIGDRRSPTKAVEDELRLPNRNVAKKRVHMARARGFLPPSPGERRGGIE